MLLTFNQQDLVYIGVWALVGSILGFLAFRCTPAMSPYVKIRQGLLSVGIGFLVAFPVTQYLYEEVEFSGSLSILLGGLSAFGLPDFILRYYPKISKAVATLVAEKIGDEVSESSEKLTVQKHKRKGSNSNE